MNLIVIMYELATGDFSKASLPFDLDFLPFILVFLYSLWIVCVFFFFKLYNIVLVLPNIEMNPPQVYLRSPS